MYAAGICDFAPLNEMFFPVQSIGFLLAGVAILAMIFHIQGNGIVALSVAPPLWKGTFLFVGLMVTGLGCMDAGLMILSNRLKKHSAIPLFVISFVCSMGMGYLSTKNFAQASMNWIAEGVNVVGQGCLLIGVW